MIDKIDEVIKELTALPSSPPDFVVLALGALHDARDALADNLSELEGVEAEPEVAADPEPRTVPAPESVPEPSPSWNPPPAPL
jgi:hypothetical protein